MEKEPKLEQKSEPEALALEVAKGLDDIENAEYYLSFCPRYPKEIIQRAFEKAKDIPEEKIKKSRGALFTFLVKEYAQDK